MAKHVFNNMCDMIAFIEDANLQRDFFRLYATHITVDWAALPSKPLKRADEIVAALDEQRGRDETAAAEHDKLFSELRTIAMVNAESENWAHLQALIDTKPAFRKFYNEYFGVSFSVWKIGLTCFSHLMATWVGCGTFGRGCGIVCL